MTGLPWFVAHPDRLFVLFAWSAAGCALFVFTVGIAVLFLRALWLVMTAPAAETSVIDDPSVWSDSIPPMHVLNGGRAAQALTLD